jgi:hypothetical protein
VLCVLVVSEARGQAGFTGYKTFVSLLFQTLHVQLKATTRDSNELI